MTLDTNDLVFDFMRDHTTELGVYAVLITAFPLSIVVIPKYYSKVMDDVKSGKGLDFRVLLLLMLLVNIMFIALEKLDSYFIPKFQEYIRYRVTKAVMEHYQSKPYETQEMGLLISTLVKLPVVVKDLISHMRSDLIPLLFSLVGTTIEFARIDLGLSGIIVGGVLISGAISARIMEDALSIAAKGEIHTDSVHEALADLFDNIADVYAMGTEEEELQKLMAHESFADEIHDQIFQRSVGIQSVINLASTVVLLGCIYYADKLRRDGKISMSQVVQVGVTSFFLTAKAGSVSGEIPGFIYNLGLYRKCREYFLSLESAPDNSTQIKEIKINRSIEVTPEQLAMSAIVWENVTVRYDEVTPLNDFTMSIAPGETLLITGKIGSGKSTLVKTLLRMVPYSGTLRLGEFSIADLPLDTLRKTILFITQSPPIMNTTIYEAVTYGDKQSTRADVEALWHKHHIDKLIPYAFDFKVGHRGENLSGGQRMVLHLVRILLLNRPRIVILDEPTASLDPESVQHVIELIREIESTNTVLIISHDDRVEVLADRTIQMEKGRLI